ncbi:MAG: transposase [Saprospiraceae bacterium]|nr:transposase [Saprospiraceae bacterium]
MMGQYIEQFEELAKDLKAISPVLVADAYFSKFEYTHSVVSQGMEFISRLRVDANLRYLYNGSQKSGRGRKKKFAGKVNTKKIDKRRVKQMYEDEEIRVYSLIVNSVNLKRNILLVCVEYLNSLGNVTNMSMYFSTNLERDAMQVVRYYKARFQMEFNFRDAKQFTGLTNCQARAEEKLHFHFNATLTAVNIGKGIARKGIDKNRSIPISIWDVKTELSNHLLLNFIFLKFGIDPNLQKNKSSINEILDFGKIAA